MTDKSPKNGMKQTPSQAPELVGKDSSSSLIQKIIPLLLVVFLALVAVYFITQTRTASDVAADQHYADIMHPLLEEYLKSSGVAPDRMKKFPLWIVLLSEDTEKRVNGYKYILEKTKEKDPSFEGSRKERILKTKLANDYRNWAKAQYATQEEKLERLMKAEGLYSDAVDSMKSSDVEYFIDTLAHARVQLDIAAATKGLEEKKENYKSTAEYLDDLIGTMSSARTGRKIAVSFHIHVLYGIALYRYIDQFDASAEEIDFNGEAYSLIDLQDRVVEELDSVDSLSDYAIMRDIARDIQRRLQTDTPSVTVQGDIDQAIETTDNGTMKVTFPLPAVIDELVQALMPPIPLRDLPPEPVPEPEPEAEPEDDAAPADGAAADEAAAEDNPADGAAPEDAAVAEDAVVAEDAAVVEEAPVDPVPAPEPADDGNGEN